MSEVQLGVIGCGNMAEALLRGALKAGVVEASSVTAADPAPDRRERFARELGVNVGDDNNVPAGCRRVLLAVKPQVMDDVLTGVADRVTGEATVISIAAGVPSSRIDQRLGGRGRIVRVMPNTPMLVGAGASALAAGPRAGDEDLAFARTLLDASGVAVAVAESDLDAVTALSGSGPAYFFYLVEAMITAAAEEGLDPDLARTLAVQTCLGAGRLLAETGDDPAELRRRVTSPGGTTQRAVETLDAGQAKGLIVRAVRAAAERSRELGA